LGYSTGVAKTARKYGEKAAKTEEALDLRGKGFFRWLSISIALPVQTRGEIDLPLARFDG